MSQTTTDRKTADSYAVFEAKTPFKPWTFDLHPLGPNDIEVKITHCGVCYSDIHTVDGDWGNQKWPIVPGHEIIGNVTAVGSEVKTIAVGQRVGVGPQALSCRKCKHCQDGWETYCQQGIITSYGSALPDGYITKGGYALYHRVDAHFAFPIPDKLESATTAPILCAGITTYTPLRELGVKEGTKVGVIGIGGLGHMALQFARAMGAEVTALSTSPDKEADAKALGAHNFFVTKSSEEEWKKYQGYFDVLLNTTNVDLDWDKYLGLVALRGTFVLLGASPAKLQVSQTPLLFRNTKIMGSLIGPPHLITEMLEFCAKHDIKAKIETRELSQVNEAVEKVRQGKVRERMVLIMPQ